ncbi:MAG: LPS export ABC transporter periplasmic protein LptC [Bacteroidales bacterium]|jgi:LPS export ABC transporter protein LptC|nr:LPS export ABC transporter periplasmic protein LptC [Bacteroidales bacterium]MBR0320862.1 LPS export ABC transporter periplasmic protein LptC [Bacteroidales bacterium]MBR1956391.1 LPS export ABC transporter periplasmic protein LptC [Bacteroidales bacterium]MBR5810646.1 LPS export ABC transporter periplasmic protein LptC [Bacteroidales bacterium]
MMATALAVAFIVYSCKGKLSEAEALNLAETPVQIVEDMFMQQTENGMVKMRAESPRMEKYEKDTLQYELFPAGFFVYAFDESGKLETEIVADNARHMKYKDGRETWEAYGNVVVKNLINQEVMETDTLYWNQETEMIYTHCYVRIISPDGFAQGYGMEADQRARSYTLFNNFNNYAFVVKDSTEVLIDSVNFIGPFPKK